jgi:hypothetical protein
VKSVPGNDLPVGEKIRNFLSHNALLIVNSSVESASKRRLVISAAVDRRIEPR